VTALVDAASDYIAPDTLAFVRETIARVAP
jgi:hypothetical protein